MPGRVHRWTRPVALEASPARIPDCLMHSTAPVRRTESAGASPCKAAISSSSPHPDRLAGVSRDSSSESWPTHRPIGTPLVAAPVLRASIALAELGVRLASAGHDDNADGRIGAHGRHERRARPPSPLRQRRRVFHERNVRQRKRRQADRGVFGGGRHDRDIAARFVAVSGTRHLPGATPAHRSLCSDGPGGRRRTPWTAAGSRRCRGRGAAD